MANQKLREQLIEARSDPRAQQFLDFLASRESGKHGYNAMVGGGRLEDLSWHPETVKTLKIKGKKHNSSAAGRYQITKDTWADIVKAIGSQDFSAEEQDLGALLLMHQAGALDDILAGRPLDAIPKLGGRWASLSSSTSGQSNLTEADEAKWFAKNPIDLSNTLPVRLAKTLGPEPATTVASGIGDAVRAVQTARKQGVFDPKPHPHPNPLPQEAEAVIEDDIANAVYLEMLRRQQAEEESPAPSPVEEAPAAEKSPGIWQRLRESIGDARARDRIEIEDSPSWEQELLSQALSADAESITHNAVNRFLGEPELTRVALPKSIEEAIDQALRSI